MVYASAFAMGAVWLVFGVTGIMDWMARLAADVRPNVDLAVLGITVVVSVAWNMALGFVAGIAVHYLARLVSEKWCLDRRLGKG